MSPLDTSCARCASMSLSRFRNVSGLDPNPAASPAGGPPKDAPPPDEPPPNPNPSSASDGSCGSASVWAVASTRCGRRVLVGLILDRGGRGAPERTGVLGGRRRRQSVRRVPPRVVSVAVAVAGTVRAARDVVGRPPRRVHGRGLIRFVRDVLRRFWRSAAAVGSAKGTGRPGLGETSVKLHPRKSDMSSQRVGEKSSAR